MPSREVISQMVAEFGVVDTGFTTGVQRMEHSMRNLETSSHMRMNRVAMGIGRMSATSVKDLDNLGYGLGMVAQGFGAARLGAIGFAAAVGVQAGNAINQLVKTITGTDLSEKLAALFGFAPDKGGADPAALAMRAKRQAGEFQKALQLAGKGIDMSKTFFTPDEMKEIAASGMQDMINKANEVMSTPENKIKMALWTHKELEEQKKQAAKVADEIADIQEEKAQMAAQKAMDEQDKIIENLRGKSLEIGGDARSLWAGRAQFEFDKPRLQAEGQRDWLARREGERQGQWQEAQFAKREKSLNDLKAVNDNMLVELRKIADGLIKGGLVVVS